MLTLVRMAVSSWWPWPGWKCLHNDLGQWYSVFMITFIRVTVSTWIPWSGLQCIHYNLGQSASVFMIPLSGLQCLHDELGQDGCLYDDLGQGDSVFVMTLVRVTVSLWIPWLGLECLHDDLGQDDSVFIKTLVRVTPWLIVCSKGPDCWVCQKMWPLKSAVVQKCFIAFLWCNILAHDQCKRKQTNISPKNLTIVLTKIFHLLYCFNITFYTLIAKSSPTSIGWRYVSP